MEETISLQEIINAIKKRIKLILLITLSFLVLGSIVTFFVMTPQYEASTQILVNQSQSGEQPITANELQSNREFINTYSVIISSPVILDQVIEETGINSSVEELNNQINVTAENESQVATLSVVDANPQTAVTLANAVAEVFEREIPEIMTVDNASILSSAQMSDNMSPVSPQPALNLIISLLIGAVLGIFVSFVLEFLDRSVKTEQDVEKYLGLPILGVVPIMSNDDLKDHSNREDKDTSNKMRRHGEKNQRKTS